MQYRFWVCCDSGLRWRVMVVGATLDFLDFLGLRGLVVCYLVLTSGWDCVLGFAFWFLGLHSFVIFWFWFSCSLWSVLGVSLTF